MPSSKEIKPLGKGIFDGENIRSKPLDFCLLGHSPERQQARRSAVGLSRIWDKSVRLKDMNGMNLFSAGTGQWTDTLISFKACLGTAGGNERLQLVLAVGCKLFEAYLKALINC